MISQSFNFRVMLRALVKDLKEEIIYKSYAEDVSF